MKMSHRIFIIGSSCAGKTTLGRKLSKALGIKQIDLDDLHWLPNWQPEDPEVFAQKITNAIEGEENWVITGSYSQFWHLSMPYATHIIFLDTRRHVLIWRLLRRTFKRVVFKEKCCGENIETFGTVFSKESLFIWQWQNFYKKKKTYESLKSAPYNPDTKFLRFASVKNVQTVIDAL